MYIRKRDAVKFYYYLIAADGEVRQSELEKFEEIGKETDTSFMNYKEEVIKECNRQIEKVIDEDEYFEVIKEGIDETLGEEEYAPEEQKLIRYMVRKMDIDKDIYLEMENAMKTIQTIDHTIALLSSRDNGFVIKGSHLEIYSSKIGEIVTAGRYF